MENMKTLHSKEETIFPRPRSFVFFPPGNCPLNIMLLKKRFGLGGKNIVSKRQHFRPNHPKFLFFSALLFFITILSNLPLLRLPLGPHFPSLNFRFPEPRTLNIEPSASETSAFSEHRTFRGGPHSSFYINRFSRTAP